MLPYAACASAADEAACCNLKQAPVHRNQAMPGNASLAARLGARSASRHLQSARSSQAAELAGLC